MIILPAVVDFSRSGRDVILRAPILRDVKILVVSSNSTSSPRYMNAVLSDTTRRLLHVMRHDGDGVVFFQFLDQFFDLCGRDRIERRARLIEQNDFGANRDGARDAQALLLTTR